MALISEVTPETNIWKEYPNLRLIREFRMLKEAEGDERSNNLIKAIFLIWDTKGKLRDSGITQDQLIKDVSESLLGDANFDWEEYEEFKDFFLSKNISKMDALLLRYEQELIGFDALLKNWKWAVKDAEKKAKLLKEYKPRFDEYIETHDKVKQEGEIDPPLEGGYGKSLLERIGTE